MKDIRPHNSRRARRYFRQVCAAGLWLGTASVAYADAAIEVTGRREGQSVIIDANMTAPVTPSTAWAVLIDYEHMSEFIPGMKSSDVISRENNVLTVSQNKTLSLSLMRLSFASTWSIQFTPCSMIVARTIAGDLGTVVGTIRLSEDHNAVRVQYHGSGTASRMFPAILSVKLAKRDATDRLEGMKDEMLRRTKSSPARQDAPLNQCGPEPAARPSASVPPEGYLQQASTRDFPRITPTRSQMRPLARRGLLLLVQH